MPKANEQTGNRWKSRIVGHDRIAPDQIVANPLNFRTHPMAQREALAAAIDEVGFIRSVTINKRTGNLVDGHERVWQALQSEQPLIDVEYVDLSEDEERKALATMDPISEMANVDPAKLDELLRDVNIGSPALQEMLADLAKNAKLYENQPVVEDEVPEPPKTPVTKSGDLWLLGDHRLLCGDCRNQGDTKRLFGQSQINVAVTSPPYAEQREYDATSGFKPIPPDDYVAWFADVQSLLRERLAPDGSFFLNIKPSSSGLDTDLYVFDLVLAFVRQWGWHLATEFCWERNGVPKNVTQRFKNQFEPVYQLALGRWKMRPQNVRHESANVPRAGGKGVGNTSWANAQGGNGEMFGAAKKRKHGGPSGWGGKDAEDAQGNNWQPGEYIGPGLAYPGNRLPTFAGSHEAHGHAAAFPVGLPSFFIQAYSDEGDTVYEPFAGSGSTLIAAQQLNRRALAVELSPAYCDVIVQRWEKLTGGKAQLEGTARKPQTKKRPKSKRRIAKSTK